MEIDGQKISEVRRLKGLTQEKLADLANVNLRTIQRIEKNSSEPQANTLNSICEVLEINIDDIVIQDDKNITGCIHGYKLASKWKRLSANLVEFLIFVMFIGVPVILYNVTVNDYELSHFDNIGIEYTTAFSLLIGALFYPFFTGNLGHQIFGLKVISAKTGEDYNKSSDGAIREFLKSMMSYLIIPIIWILWDEKNQNLYDKFTKTLVVEKNEVAK